MPKRLDAFGGFTGIKGRETGDWHTEEIDDRHWFITPEGHAMYVLGINHVQASDDEEKEQAIENLRKWNFNTGG